MPLASLLQPGSTLVLPGPATRDEALALIARHAADRLLTGVSAQVIADLLIQRETRTPTGVPEGVAFPHAVHHSITATALLVSKWGTPLDFRSSNRVDLVFTMFGSDAEPWRHVRLLARLARIIRGPGALERLRAAPDAEALRVVLLAEDQSHD